jgi:hypothetical protein
MRDFFSKRLSRRRLIGAATRASGALAAASLLPRHVFAADNVIKIGFLAPLTGDVAA